MRTAHRDTLEEEEEDVQLALDARPAGQLPIVPSLAAGAITAALVALLLIGTCDTAQPVEEELPVSFCLPRRSLSGRPACTCAAGPTEVPGAASEYRQVLDSWHAAGVLTVRDLHRLEGQMLLACGLPPHGASPPARAGMRAE